MRSPEWIVGIVSHTNTMMTLIVVMIFKNSLINRDGLDSSDMSFNHLLSLTQKRVFMSFWQVD